MTDRGRAAVTLGACLAVLIAAAGAARAEPCPVIGDAHPPWFTDLVHEMETAGFATDCQDQRWALRVSATAPDRIAVVRRSPDDQDWIVDEAVTVPRSPAGRRRAIVRAVEILRVRQAANELPPAAAEQKPPAKTEAATATIVAVRTPTNDQAAPRIARIGRLSVGAGAGVSASGGGVGAVPAVGLVLRWTGQRLALWSRAAGAVVASTVSGAEGRAVIRVLTLALGGAFLPGDTSARRWSPLVGAELTGIFAGAAGAAAAGYHGHTALVSGLAASGVAGLWFEIGERVGVAVAGSVGVVLWEPVIAFADRPAAAIRGLSAAANVDLSWRF